MSLLIRFGIIEDQFWKKNWQYAIFIFLVFSAMITPGGTGIAILLLSLPLTGLYFLGTLMTTNKGRNFENIIDYELKSCLDLELPKL